MNQKIVKKRKRLKLIMEYVWACEKIIKLKKKYYGIETEIYHLYNKMTEEEQKYAHENFNLTGR
jgi:hypothetical protein